MRSNIRLAIMLSVFAAVLTLSSAGFAQMVGGFRAVVKTDPGAVAAANFAVEAQSEKSENEYTLEEIVKAERQVVQGSNYRLCMEISADGGDTFYVQAVVYVDLKGKRTLRSWADSRCGEAPAPVVKPIVGGYKMVAATDAQVVAAANFAAAAQTEKMETEFAVEEILNAGRQVVQGTNYRICMLVSAEGDEPLMISAIVYQDLKRNYKLTSWKEAECDTAQ